MLRLLLFLPALAATCALAAEPAPARRAEILHMVKQDCGSCHGLTMKGGLGPSLEPRVLAGKDSAGLAFTILRGRPGTPMPPWNGFVTEREAQWIVEQLMKGLPE